MNTSTPAVDAPSLGRKTQTETVPGTASASIKRLPSRKATAATAHHPAAASGGFQTASLSGTSKSAASSAIASARGIPPVTPRIIFGAGTIRRLPTELGRLRLSSPLIVSSPSRISLARRVQALIPNLDSSILDSSLVNVPQRVLEDAVARVTGRDCVISIGGASAVRLAGATGSRKSIPHICVPTSYSGSEAPRLGTSSRRSPRSRRRRSTAAAAADMDANFSPAVIIYDEELTATSSPMTIPAPNDLKPSGAPHHRRDRKDDDAQWSYIHLPGV